MGFAVTFNKHKQSLGPDDGGISVSSSVETAEEIRDTDTEGGMCYLTIPSEEVCYLTIP